MTPEMYPPPPPLFEQHVPPLYELCPPAPPPPHIQKRTALYPVGFVYVCCAPVYVNACGVADAFCGSVVIVIVSMVSIAAVVGVFCITLCLCILDAFIGLLDVDDLCMTL